MNLNQDFRLGEWTVHPDKGVFINGGIKRHAEPKLIDVLIVLARHQGDVVSRDQLLEEAWAGVVVSDEVLTRCISELRTLLGDTSRERRFIRTIPRRGYMLVAPVVLLGSEASIDVLKNEEADRVVESEQSPSKEAGAIQSAPLNKQKVVKIQVPWAVQLLMDFFGLLRTLAGALVKMSAFALGSIVVIVLMTFAFIGHRDDDEPVTVTILTDSDDETDRSADVTHRLETIKDVVDLGVAIGLEVQKELEQEVAKSALKADTNEENLELSPGLGGAVESGTNNFEAYEKYLLGRNFWQKRTQPSLAKAVNYFQQAVDRDENYALAWAGLADTLVLQAFYGYGEREQLLQDADQSSMRAVELAPNLAEVQAARGLFLSESGRLDEALVSFNKAIKLKPRFSMAHMWLGNAYLGQGQARKAFESYRRAYELEPMHKAVRLNYLSGLGLVGKTQEARLLAERFASESGDFTMLPIKEAIAAGYYDRALDMIVAAREKGSIDEELQDNALLSLIYLDNQEEVQKLRRSQPQKAMDWKAYWLDTLTYLKARDARSLFSTIDKRPPGTSKHSWCEDYKHDLISAKSQWLEKKWLEVERAFSDAMNNHSEKCWAGPEEVILSYLYQALAVSRLGDKTGMKQHLDEASKVVEDSWNKGWRNPEFMVAALAWSLIEGDDAESRKFLDFMQEHDVQPWGMLTMMPLLDEYLDEDVLGPYKAGWLQHYRQQQKRVKSITLSLMGSL